MFDLKKENHELRRQVEALSQLLQEVVGGIARIESQTKSLIHYQESHTVMLQILEGRL
jgi:hypothetical protein